MLMGLGDLVGRGGAASHEGDAWVGGGGNVWAHGGAGEEENIQSTEDDQPQQGLNTQYSIHSNVKLFSKAFITTQVNTCTHAIMPNT